MANFALKSSIFQIFKNEGDIFRYYLKGAENAPAGGKTFSEYTSRFKDLTGMDCPYKLGEMLKFPGQNLSKINLYFL